jgi:uncharacterized protein (DUF427 family)
VKTIPLTHRAERAAHKIKKPFVRCRIQRHRNVSVPMVKAFWAGKLIAESNSCVVVEGNQYFPVQAVKKQYLKSSQHTSICPWKGTAHYYHVEVDGLRNDNAAWFYPDPKPAAAEISGRVAFWKGVRVEG